MNRGSFKDKGLADLIFQETQVREVHELFFIDKDDKGRWFGRYLGRIENLETFALVSWRRINRDSIHDDIIEHR